MNIQSHSPVTALRQRMIEDMTARNLGRHSQRSHLHSCERFASFLHRSPETATADDKPPAAGPNAVLAYLSRYTHRVAISNSRLVSADQRGVTFRCKDYRLKGAARYGTMTLPTHEFIRRFLIHVLPKRFHRIRHYGFLANGNRAANLAQARQLLAGPGHDNAPAPETPAKPDEPNLPAHPCPRCGGPMVIIETFEPGQTPTHHRQRAPPPRDIS